jgi:hypothetical protein
MTIKIKVGNRYITICWKFNRLKSLMMLPFNYLPFKSEKMSTAPLAASPARAKNIRV